jgi:hypothetical protein
MFQESSPLILFLFINSFFTVGLIFNQNDNVKDSVISQKVNSQINPLETFTWFCFFLQLALLLFKLKIKEY